MKQLFLGAGFILAIVAITFFGCQKDEMVNPEKQNQQIQNYVTSNISVKSGMVVFKDQEIFKEKLNELSTMNRKEREEWEQGIGFTSQATIYDRINDAEMALEQELFRNYDESLSREELAALGVEIRHTDIYNEYLKNGLIKENKYNDGSESFELTVNEYEILINEEGFMMVGNSIFKYEKNTLKIITDGNFEKIDLLNSVNESNNTLNILVKKTNQNLKSGYNWSKNSGYKMDGSNYRVIMYVVGSSSNEGTAVQAVTYYVEVKAERKMWGSWKMRNSYNPLQSLTGNWVFRYGIGTGSGNYTTLYSVSPTSGSTSPLNFAYANSNHYKVWLNPNGTWGLSSPWYYWDAFNVYNYYFYLTVGGMNNFSLSYS